MFIILVLSLMYYLLLDWELLWLSNGLWLAMIFGTCVHMVNFFKGLPRGIFVFVTVCRLV